MKTGCEYVKCTLLVDGKCESTRNTCVYRTNEERVEELESMVDQIKAELATANETTKFLEGYDSDIDGLMAENKRLRDALSKISVCHGYSECPNIARRAIKGD